MELEESGSGGVTPHSCPNEIAILIDRTARGSSLDGDSPLLFTRRSIQEVVQMSAMVGRDIPNFFILVIKVVRASPSWAAAPRDPPITQLAVSSASRINAR